MNVVSNSVRGFKDFMNISKYKPDLLGMPDAELYMYIKYNL